jgi:hypothetical protein
VSSRPCLTIRTPPGAVRLVPETRRPLRAAAPSMPRVPGTTSGCNRGTGLPGGTEDTQASLPRPGSRSRPPSTQRPRPAPGRSSCASRQAGPTLRVRLTIAPFGLLPDGLAATGQTAGFVASSTDLIPRRYSRCRRSPADRMASRVLGPGSRRGGAGRS